MKLLGNKLLVLPEKGKNEHGLFVMPSKYVKAPQRGLVVLAGPGKYRLKDGKFLSMNIEIGDTVMYTKGDYQEIEYNDAKHIVISENNVVAHTSKNATCSDCKNISRLKSTPFYDKENEIFKFEWQATRDIVFICPDPLPEKYSEHIVIPEHYREFYGCEYGVILAAGAGYYDKYCKFRSCGLKVGDYVAYDKDVLWKDDFIGIDGKEYVVKYMGEQDVRGIIQD